ncbi:AsnC family transcriptional regulator [Kocuria rosea subsp. polaris]|uniref:AsnC family transcriptional regulator n=1 Tax=Kocuria rosea subsp. polaris TaxID=136273 RepID=A0A0W8IAK7_KOCRO|nr:GntR family transcriptional regulator [Kocuria polaris]KUG57020.1 AsnC family transcriptional regulator [Kocuria polaris]
MTEAVRVRRGLEEAIVAGRYRPGDKLDLTSISAEYGCSRTPIRDALQHLSNSGMVQIRPKHGTFVSRLGVRELAERFEVMADLEGLCAELAARRMPPGTAAEMTAALEACRRFVQEGDPDGYYDANSRFHRAIYAGSGNEFLRAEAEKLQGVLEVYRRLQLRVGDRMARSLDEHRAIAEAVLAHDPETARAQARAHVQIQADEYTELVLRSET